MTQTPKHDKQGWAYYTAQQVKQMADEHGLPCQIVDYGTHTSVMPMPTLEALSLNRVWNRYYPHDYSTGRSTYSNIPAAKVVA